MSWSLKTFKVILQRISYQFRYAKILKGYKEYNLYKVFLTKKLGCFFFVVGTILSNSELLQCAQNS